MDALLFSSPTPSHASDTCDALASLSETLWDGDNTYSQSLWPDVYTGSPRTTTTLSSLYSQDDNQQNPYTFPDSPIEGGILSPNDDELKLLVEQAISPRSRAPESSPPCASFYALSDLQGEKDASEDVLMEAPFESSSRSHSYMDSSTSWSPPAPLPGIDGARWHIAEGHGPEEATAELGKNAPSSNRGSQENNSADNIAELHSLYPPSDYAIYCPWPTRHSTTTVPSQCDMLIRLTQFETHLKNVHHLKRGVQCQLPLCFTDSGDLTGRVCGEHLTGSFSRHVLGQASRGWKGFPRMHAGPLQGCEADLMGKDGRGRERVELPKLACKYCGMEFAPYIGGHKHSLSRHLKERCTKFQGDLAD